MGTSRARTRGGGVLTMKTHVPEEFHEGDQTLDSYEGIAPVSSVSQRIKDAFQSVHKNRQIDASRLEKLLVRQAPGPTNAIPASVRIRTPYFLRISIGANKRVSGRLSSTRDTLYLNISRKATRPNAIILLGAAQQYASENNKELEVRLPRSNVIEILPEAFREYRLVQRRATSRTYTVSLRND